MYSKLVLFALKKMPPQAPAAAESLYRPVPTNPIIEPSAYLTVRKALYPLWIQHLQHYINCNKIHDIKFIIFNSSAFFVYRFQTTPFESTHPKIPRVGGTPFRLL